MSRFYKTSRGTPADWAYDMPYQEMFQGLGAKQMQQDAEIAKTKKWEAQSQKLRSLEKDNDQAEGIMKWIDSSADKFSGMDLTDRVNKNQVRDFSREVAKTFSQYGAAGNIQANYDARAARYKELKEIHKDNPMMVEKAMRGFDDKYKGVGGQEKYGAEYENYGSRGISKYQDNVSQVRTAMLDAEQDIVKGEFTTAVIPYFVNETEFTKMKPVERMERVMESVLSQGANQDYIRDAVEFGYESGLTKESYEADMYKEVPVLQEDGTTKMQKQLNDKSYKAKLFKDTYGSIGSTYEKSSKTTNNSLYNQDRAWSRKKAAIDALFQVTLTENLDAKTNRETIDLVGEFKNEDVEMNHKVETVSMTRSSGGFRDRQKLMEDTAEKYNVDIEDVYVNPIRDLSTPGKVTYEVGYKRHKEDMTFNDFTDKQKNLVTQLNNGNPIDDFEEGLTLLTNYQNFRNAHNTYDNAKIDIPQSERLSHTKEVFGDKNLNGYLEGREYSIRSEDSKIDVPDDKLYELMNSAKVGGGEGSPRILIDSYNTAGAAGGSYIGGETIRITDGDDNYTIIAEAKPEVSNTYGVQGRIGINDVKNNGSGEINFYKLNEKGETVPTTYDVKTVWNGESFESKLSEKTTQRLPSGEEVTVLMPSAINFDQLQNVVKNQLENDLSREESNRMKKNNATTYMKMFQ
jgi:hypothetical protein